MVQSMGMKQIIQFEDFAKLDLRVGKIVDCTEKEGSERLLRLTVDFGDEGKRTILSGIKQWYRPEDLMGKLFIFISNLEPRNIMGEDSEGMILATDGEKPYPLIPSGDVTPGTTIR